MKNNKLYSELLSEGFSEKTLSSLSEKQIKVLHSKIFEATYKVSADKVDTIKDKVSDDDTVEVTEEDNDAVEEELNEEPDFTKPVSPDKGWNQDVRSKNVSDNRVDSANGTLNSVKFVEKGNQAKEVSKSGHTGFAQPNKKINIGGKKAGSKSTSGSSMNESRTTKKDLIKFIQESMGMPTLASKSKTDNLPDFMNLDIFDGKVADLMGNAPVETPVKPTTTPGTKPGKPIIKPKHSPKPKAQMEEENELEENGRTFAGGDETKGGLPKQRGSKHPAMKDLSENGRTLAGGDETKGGLPKQKGSKHPQMKK